MMHRRHVLGLLAASMGLSYLPKTFAQSEQRVISIGSALTEMVYELGAQASLVGVDTTSYYPLEAQGLPSVGYARSLSAEGLLSLRPHLIVSTEDAGPPSVLKQLQDIGVNIQILAANKSVQGVLDRIHRLGELLGRVAQATALRQRVSDHWQKVERTVHAHAWKKPPRVLFLLSTNPAQLMVGGQDTSAAAMIRFAGGVNVADEVTGWKSIGTETLLAMAPDIILVTEQGADGVGGIERLARLPGIALTPAGQQQRIIRMETMFLLGFGPRLPWAVEALHQAMIEHIPD